MASSSSPRRTQLIYTRRIIQPVAAAKLTGKAFGTDLAFLSAVDDRAASATGEDHPVFNLLRVQRDIGSQSRLGLVYTDKIDGDNYNRVAGYGCAPRVRRRVQRAAAAGRQPHPHQRDHQHGSPLAGAVCAQTAAPSGCATSLPASTSSFRARSGFISRPGIAHATLNHRATVYGKRGGLVESFTGDVTLDGTWEYQRFVHGEGIQDKKLHFNTNTTLQGGWKLGGSILVESFGYPADVYADYAIEVPGPAAPAPTRCRSPALRPFPTSIMCSPWKRRSSPTSPVTSFFLWGSDENFYEWASANIYLARPHTGLAADRQARVERDLPASVSWPPHRRQHGEHLAVPGSSSNTSCPGPSSCGWSASILPSDGLPSRRHPDQRADSDPRCRKRGTIPAPRRSGGAPSGVIFCSPISPPPEPCSSPATAAPSRTQPSSARRTCNGQRTASSSSSAIYFNCSLTLALV